MEPGKGWEQGAGLVPRSRTPQHPEPLASSARSPLHPAQHVAPARSPRPARHRAASHQQLPRGTQTVAQHTVVSPSQHSKARSKAKSPPHAATTCGEAQRCARSGCVAALPGTILPGSLEATARGDVEHGAPWPGCTSYEQPSTAQHPAPAPAPMRAAGAEASSTSAPPPAGLAASRACPCCPRGQT